MWWQRDCKGGENSGKFCTAIEKLFSEQNLSMNYEKDLTVSELLLPLAF